MTVSDTGVYAMGARVTCMTSLNEVEAQAPTSATPVPGTPALVPSGGPLTARRARTRQRLMAAAVAVFAEREIGRAHV